MQDMYLRSFEIYKIISYILSDDCNEYFSFSQIENITNLKRGEIKKVIMILNEYNVVFPKKRVGLFKNQDEITKLRNSKLIEGINNDLKIISSDFINFKFSLFEYLTLDFLQDKMPSIEKVLTIIVLFHCTYNFIYHKELYYDGTNINIDRYAIKANENYVFFEVKQKDKNVRLYR